MNNLIGSGRRVAIVHGLRTPFVKCGTIFSNLNSLDLGKRVTVELINRSEIDPEDINQVIFGTVIPTVKTPNLSREIALGAGIPCSVPAYTVSSACASSIQAITNGAESIMIGDTDVVVAGGTESISNMPVLFSNRFRSSLQDFYKTKNPVKKVKSFFKLRFRDLLPDIPEIAELSTGLTMVHYADKIAKEYQISRKDQDSYSLRSHKLASQGTEDGRLSKELIGLFLPPNFTTVVNSDNGIQKDVKIEDLTSYSAAYDKRYGSVTAGNASALSDGAGVVLMMSEEKANALGYEPLGYIKSYAYAALSPDDQLLMGTVYSTPVALERAGLDLKNIDLIEMHEAYASQVLSNIKALASKKFAEEKLGKSVPVGEIDMDKFNVLGGSIAIGHPFGSTGVRLVITLLNELRRRGGNFGMVTTCASGGLGVTMILERE